jgi:hypothetical protein
MIEVAPPQSPQNVLTRSRSLRRVSQDFIEMPEDKYIEPALAKPVSPSTYL